MAGMTPTQVEQIVNQQTSPTPVPSDPSIPDLPPDWNPTPPASDSGVPYYLARPDQQAAPYTPIFGGETGILDPTGRYTFYPPSKYHAGWVVADKSTGGLRAATADELATLGAGGAGGAGPDHYATDVAAANEQARLAEQQREFGLTFPESQRQYDLTHGLNVQQEQGSVLQNRATTGLNLGQFAQSLANDQFKRAEDPGNYPAYLAASAGLPRGSGSPIDQLLGNGVQIAQPQGGNPLADPRFQQLMDQLYGYAQPQNISTVQNIAANNGGTLPQSFYDYTHTQSPADMQAHATGGSQMLHEPVIGIGLHSGQPQFLAGEAGDEKLTFTPAVHSHSDGGQPIPHSHDRGDQKHEHMDANSPATYADGGTAQIQPYDSSTNDPMQGQTQYPTGTQKPLPTSTTPTAAGPASGLSGPIGGGGLAGGSTSPVGSAANGTYSWDQPDPNMQRVSDAYARDPAAAQRFFSQSPTNLQQMFGQSNPQDFWNQYGGYSADAKARLQTIAQNGGLTPAQGTNIALGKGLQALGWVNNNLVQHLLTGDSPTPGMIDDQTLMRLPPSYRALLQAAIRAQVGSAGLGDYAQSQQDFAMPGLGSSYPTASYG